MSDWPVGVETHTECAQEVPRHLEAAALASGDVADAVDEANKHLADSVEQAADFLFEGGSVKRWLLIALNAEKVVMAERSPALRAVLEEAEMKYADGISVVRALHRKYPDAVATRRIPGCELWEALMARAGRARTPVFLVGGTPEVLAETERRLKARWDVVIVGRRDGYFEEDERAALMAHIRESRPAIVTLALGSPKQEMFMRDCRRIYPDALYMGVGGTYDVFSGRTRRAPPAWRALGLEWLHRTLSQPTRLRRLKNLATYAWLYATKQL